MAITGVNTYNNAYENVYATKQKDEAKETSAAQKRADTENKSSLLGQLQDKYSNFDIMAGTFSKSQVSSSSRGFQGVMISSAYLSKAENEEAAVAERNNNTASGAKEEKTDRAENTAEKTAESGADGEKVQDGVSGAGLQAGAAENVQQDDSTQAENAQPVETAVPEAATAQAAAYTHVDVCL